MLKVQRLEQIQEELQKHGVLSIEALAEALHVSQSTIRRDLFELEEQGEVLKRIRGGVLKAADVDKSNPLKFGVVAEDNFFVGGIHHHLFGLDFAALTI